MNGGGSKGVLVVTLCLAAVVGGVVYYQMNSGPKEGDEKAASGSGNSGKAAAPVSGTPVTYKSDQTFDVPFIFWGGDVATFQANGGLETKPDSLFAKHGLKVKLSPGDDFDKQLENYLSGKTPFLRGTLSMLGQASDRLTAQGVTTPVVFLQLTWSAGDHLVGREALKRLEHLRGKKIALQEGGPHVGMLNDILRTAGLGWNDIKVAWTKDVSGDKGPAALFRSDATVDACFAISPEMFELTSAPDTGGIESVGDGTKKSVKGAHVVISTAQMSRSIADVYACRSDFYNANRAWVENFTAAYLKACEDLVGDKKRATNKDKDAEARYKQAIKMAQDIWGKDPQFKDSVAKEDDVDGLISDAVFVGLPGNESFFKNKGNLSGFAFKQQQALRLPGDPSKEPLKTNPRLFTAADLDYAKVRALGSLQGKEIRQGRIRAEPKVEPELIVYSFKVAFEPNQSKFPPEQYGTAFQQALELASLYGNMAVAIRGHADPSLFVNRTLQVATQKGVLKKTGNSYVFAADSSPFNPRDIKQVLALVDKSPGLGGQVEGGYFPVQEGMRRLQQLSEERAEEVRRTVIAYAQQRGLLLDQTQFRKQGVGLREPIDIHIEDGFDPNRRVEFSIIKVPLKDVNTDEFDL
jgi:ABC-type nitrate/sulfonate/bicarbonate transport system substrate-binding protein/outer membrane protein OmpA-like peptidoglycan-associated protein